MSTTPDGAVAGPQQIIADLQRANAELQLRLDESNAERDEALQQQTATSEVLQVIKSSPGDLVPVFEAMLDKAMRLCEAAFGILWTYDGELFHAAATRNLPTAFEEYVRQPQRAHPEASIGRVVAGEQLVINLDVASEALYRAGNPLRRALVELARARSQLTAALRQEDRLLGVFTIWRQEVRPFTDRQIALLQNFAAQAVIAMENARLVTETREALEQQTATAEVLSVINASPGELGPVFDVILEKAHDLCGVARGSLELYDGKSFYAVAARGLSDSFTDQLRRGYPASANPATRPLIEGEPFSHILDRAALDFPFARDASDVVATGTLLCVPLRRDDRLLGMIAAARREVRPFTEKQIALLQNFAAQAVIAIENARLITETQEALDQQIATTEVLGVINSSPGDLAPVFDAVLEKAMRLCEASFGYLLTYDGERLHSAADRGHPAFATWVRAQGAIKPEPGTTNARLVAGEDMVHVPDVTGEAGFPGNSSVRRAVIEIGGFRTMLSVALRKDDALLGIIHIYRQEVRPFTDKQIALLQNFAAQAVIAMENARLLGELRQRTEEVADLNRGLEAQVAEQVEELGRVGRLKRFLAPQLAELIVSQGDENILESHRREIVVVFCDLRGYTAFTETAEPEEVLDFLREYHGALGPLVSQFEGTLDQFSGDGIMVFFNDPVPIPDPAERAVKMAVAMREAAGSLIVAWRERGRDLGFGVGIAQGYATLGQIGFAERSGYTAIGTVCNVAARLCAEAKDGQILLGQRVNVALKGSVVTEQVGTLALKGLTQPVVAYNVPLAATQPALRVIEGGPASV